MGCAYFVAAGIAILVCFLTIALQVGSPLLFQAFGVTWLAGTMLLIVTPARRNACQTSGRLEADADGMQSCKIGNPEESPANSEDEDEDATAVDAESFVESSPLAGHQV